MSRTLLDFEYEFDFVLFGLSSHQKDYRLAWFLNRDLNWQLVKNKNLELTLKKGESESFARSSFHDETNHLHYDLISNLGQEAYLIPEQKEADYFLRIEGEMENHEIRELLTKIKKIEIVNMAFEIDPTKLKSKNNLFFE